MQPERFNDEEYLNWIRTSLSLYYLKDGLKDINDEKAAELHREITERVALTNPSAAASTCTVCSNRSATRTKTKTSTGSCTTWTMNCNICDAWLNEILPYHICSRFTPCPNIAWENSNPLLWPTNAWEVAKLFQPIGCADSKSAEEVDCTSLLTLMQDCTFFHPCVSNTALLKEIKEVRNACMHSSDLKCTDIDMKKALDVMVSLLEEPSLKYRQVCEDAKFKIQQLRDNKLDLSLNKELELKAIENRMSAICSDTNNLSGQMRLFKTDLADMASKQGATVEDCRRISEKVGDAHHQIAELKCILEALAQTVYFTVTVEVREVAKKVKELELDSRNVFHETMRKLESRLHDLEAKKAEAEQNEEENKVKCIQRKLTSLYEKHCQKVPIYPMRPSWRKRVDDLYVKPNMIVEDPDGKRLAKRDEIAFETVEKVREIFFSKGEFCKDIYIIAEAGCGKTTLCEHLVNLWVKSQTGPAPLTEDQSFMKMFTFLFYVSLREANKTFDENHHVENMIASQLGLGLGQCEVSNLFTEFNCLVIMDGLDEVTKMCQSAGTRFGSQNLPEKTCSGNCFFITTSRPWKLETLARELEGHIERLISIKGLEETSQRELANKVVALLNTKGRKSKDGKTFLRDMASHDLKEYLETPVLLMQMLGLWYSDISLGGSQCDVYTTLIEKQIEFVEKVREISEGIEDSDIQGIHLPACFKDKKYCKKYTSLLVKLAKLAFERLFNKDRASELVFDHDDTDICGMRDEEVQQLLHIGLLTQHKICGELVEELKAISFLHKSHQEFFAAVHMSAIGQNADLSRLFREIICDLDRVFEMEKIFLYVCGLAPNVAVELCSFIAKKVSDDPRVVEYRRSPESYHVYQRLILKIQNMVLAGAKEAMKHGHVVSGRLILQDIRVWHGKTKANDALACDTTKVKSVFIGAPLYQEKYCDIGTWPQSTQLEKLDLFRVNIVSPVNEIHVFSADQLRVLQLLNVEMAHEYIAKICEKLSTAENLRKIQLTELSCSTHKGNGKACGSYLDLSKHTNLQFLGLRDVNAGELSYIRMCPNNDKLETVWLREIRMSSEGLDTFIDSLPEFKGGVELEPVIIEAHETALDVIERLRQSPGVTIVKDAVKKRDDTYRVTLNFLKTNSGA